MSGERLRIVAAAGLVSGGGDCILNLRVATPADVPALRALIDASARALSANFYSPAQIDAAVTHVFGVDSQLIADGTYFLIEGPEGLAASGGWSARSTLYGGDQMKSEEDPRLDPSSEPARIRAFFVHPRWARHGLARRLYAACVQAAWTAGFRRFELMSTKPGEPFYAALGFTVVERVITTLPNGVEVPFTRMSRAIDSPTETSHSTRESPLPWPS
jgi:GNAT superfamily N-acetyltransferase